MRNLMKRGYKAAWPKSDTLTPLRSSPRIIKSAILLLAVLCVAIWPPLIAEAQNPGTAVAAASSEGPPRFDKPRRLTLEQCIDLALKYNRMRKASKASREIAEAQYKQALSAYWPQLSLTSTGTRMESPPLFIFPASPLPLGSAGRPLAEAIATAQLLKNPLAPPPGTPAYNAVLAGIADTVQKGLETSTMPAQEIKLMDRDTLVTSLELIYPLYTGGKRSALTTQAKLGIEFAKEASRRTDLQVIHDVKVYYYSSLLAKKLLEQGQETLERFEVTLELTENLYKHGSGKVKKTDYLRTQVIVASIRSFIEQLKSNEWLARSALVNAMGLDWHSEVEPIETDIPFKAYGGDLEKLVAGSHQSNPQMIQVELGIGVSEAKVKEARSGHLPVLVFFGNINRIDNSYDAGIMAPENKKNWNLGIRMELPLFKGFRTTNEEREASARVEKIRQERLLLKEGVALQVKDAFLQVARAQAQVKATKEALDAAVENRDLNTRAYRDELVETKDVIEAQMMEFFINGQYLKALYDNVAGHSDLEFIVGKGMNDTTR
jgi:outer membrane protein